MPSFTHTTPCEDRDFKEWRPWRVEVLSLLRYETHDIAGRLRPVGHLSLTAGLWAEKS